MLRRSFGVFVAMAALAQPGAAQVILGAGDPALAGATVVTFESFLVGEYPELTTGNVTISAPDAGETLRIAPEGEGGLFGHAGQHLQNDFGSTSPLLFSFLNGVSAFGIRHGAMDRAATLNVYNSAMSLLGTTSITPTFGDPAGGYIGWKTGGADIAYAEVVTVPGDWVQFDDLAYVTNGSVVPEPATLLLLGSGLLGIAFVARRREEETPAAD